MAIRMDYVARETGNNLIRNPSLTIATVLTVAVSLALLGAALVIQQGVSGLNGRFEDDVEFIVWMVNDADQEQVASVDAALNSSPGVKDHRFVNQAETYAEFESFWKESPEVLDTVSPETCLHLSELYQKYPTWLWWRALALSSRANRVCLRLTSQPITSSGLTNSPQQRR